MYLDLTRLLLMVLASDLVVIGIAAVAGFFVLRLAARSMRAIGASRRAKRLAHARGVSM